MIQYHRIRLNEAFSSNTTPFLTELRNVDGYYVYGNKIGGGVVTRFNVRSFLNDSKNQVIINDFIAYLSGSTNDDELVKILGDDEQLTYIFNTFYETSVMNGMPTSSNVISQTMFNVSGITYQNLDHHWNGVSNPDGLDNIPMSIDDADRIMSTRTVSSRFTLDNSYFIPVFIRESYAEMSPYAYDSCPTRISLILRPDLNVFESTTETQGHRVFNESENIIVMNENVSMQDQQPVSVQFTVLANGLVARCYESQCVDNRYCDILYFANQRITQLNAIDTEHIRHLIGNDVIELTEDIVLNVLMNEMIRMGEPVALPIFSCML